jgi:hypothetical protein
MPTAHQRRQVSQEARNARAGQAERDREQQQEQARQEGQ